ncbi:hypothetical protein ABDK56_02045 [Sphingomonas sp. ASV193]|uniref:hypothetical protein n=1 Tax=Sphingomonas sp. ASV193 TaxID=3144405 RepID=UPI0032E85948
MRSTAASLIALSMVALGVSACAAQSSVPVHAASALDSVGAGCGLPAGALLQDQRASRMLIVDQPDVGRAQLTCVDRWSRANGLRAVTANIQFADGTASSTRLAALAAAAPMMFVLRRMEPTELPAIEMDSRMHRLVAVTITGAPSLIAPLKSRLSGEGWTVVRAPDPNIALISPQGHSLDQVTALSFRVSNGEFGDVKMSVTMKPEGKRDE